MMNNNYYVTINETWYNDIKDSVECTNVYHYANEFGNYVELDTNEEEFNRVSTEKGWM